MIPFHLFGLLDESIDEGSDDGTRVGRAKVLADDQEPTTVGFLEHAYTWDAAQGVTIRWLRTDNQATTGATR